MNLREMKVPDAYVFTPRQHHDDRGVFLEFFKTGPLSDAIGHPLTLAQANCSVSSRGTLRGIHFAQVPPGQAKYVTCVAGAGLDVVVDLRVGSPTFGEWDAEVLDETDRRAVYVAEGLGHAFMALSPNATLIYLCSDVFRPSREHRVHPLDPDIGIDWPRDVSPILSPKDQSAPTLAEVQTQGLLASYDETQSYYASLRDGTAK
jgi:dTDP-4-dehydrorhamnose 3,5-epimerase